MTKRTDADLYAEEQVERLNRAGLTEEVIAENENKLHVSKPLHRMAFSTNPPRLPLSKIAEYAAIDAWCDATEGRKPLAAVRWIEARLHFENMAAFGAYVAAYHHAYEKRMRAA